jgi:hypothetical protein
MKHKYAEIIKAWADGAEIQWRDPKYADSGWDDIKEPSWVTCYEYRIKPEEKKPVVRWLWAYEYQITPVVWGISNAFRTEEEVKIDFPDVNYIKLEYTRQEFPE